MFTRRHLDRRSPHAPLTSTMLYLHITTVGEAAIAKINEAAGTAWLPSRVDFLVPVLALSKLCRARYKALVKRSGLLEKIDRAVLDSNLERELPIGR